MSWQGSAGATFRFVPALHEPGARTVLGSSYADGGEQQARAIIHDLVAAPATALHIATKLARHFVADDPPPALVQRLADTFARTGGDLTSVYRELVASPEAWQPARAKFKSPWDWAISSLRALGRREMAPTQAANLMNQLGQPVWRPGSPAGYADIAATWAAPDALMRRVEMAQRLASRRATQRRAALWRRACCPARVSEATQTPSPAPRVAARRWRCCWSRPEFLRR